METEVDGVSEGRVVVKDPRSHVKGWALSRGNGKPAKDFKSTSDRF